MGCRWVTKSRWTTFGRRVVITSAVFGLTTVGSAGAVLAAPYSLDRSPAADVVARAPMAVSVTFDEPLRPRGARMRVITAEGDVGTGDVSTGDRTLRRDLRLGAPAGPYRVEWRAVSASGRRMSGTFTFTAARSNGTPERRPPDAVTNPSTPGSVVDRAPGTAEPRSAPDSTTGPQGSAAPDASAGSASPGSDASAGPDRSVRPSRTPLWAEDPVWTGGPTLAGAPAGGGPGSGSDAGDAPGVSTGLTAVPLAVGGFLVLAAGLVSLANRRHQHG